MKRKIILILILCIFLIIGCSKDKKTVKPNNQVRTNHNSVVLYFSATGNTKEIAQRIAKLSNSDIVEIIPKEKYTSEDLNYNSDCRANREQNDSKARPEIKNKIDISKYDTIYLGYPIWWGTNPKIILTLLETYDFTNKTIIPFCTSGSSGIEQSINDLKNNNSKLNIRNGKRFSKDDSDELIQSFINSSNEVTNTLNIIINNQEYKIDLEDNETVESFTSLLPLELNMSELNGNEKYAYLDKSLSTNPSNPKHIEKGDVMLYGDNCLVIFYKSFDTSYNYTKIGHIDNLPNLGKENIKVKLLKR